MPKRHVHVRNDVFVNFCFVTYASIADIDDTVLPPNNTMPASTS